VERQAVLDQAFDAYPERFPRGRPTARQPAREVWINKPKATDVGAARSCIEAMNLNSAILL
jgi:hypothetical protein